MNRPLIIDTNLAILLIVGSISKGQIKQHKRLGKYDQTDFEILEEFVVASSELIFTPNVLTETCNLVRQSKEPWKTRFVEVLVTIAQKRKEQIVRSVEAVSREEYRRLGLTDAGLLYLAKMLNDAVILTDDLLLYLAAAKAGLEAINFTHVRDQRPDFR
ncbi:hypothetical protein SAZ10_31965 [Mesorhizobium sp. BAC0120]|uniref:hypothetical protein n=1 Tax=Mesorhizobium sp. BAC0120 TaxID=3090670 RepID=UPI00298D13C4|nr:hypothetical protein [Mesorhizobium sp. BAC0120]MDW6026387.1 hypothetical protein [Mesorhizobium sp. BAC0120]